MLKSGSVIEKYEIIEPIAGGGMGVVYRARHVMLGVEVAFKLLLPNLALSQKVQRRFQQEAYVQAQLKHPHIVSVTDFVADAGLLAIVMELVDGPSLEPVLAEERPGVWTFEQTMSVMKPVLEAVAFAHARGVVHRDIKPGNVLLDRSLGAPGLGTPKVSDFGLAKILSSEVAMTKTGARMGTVPYMAPEQFRGSKEIDARTDVYALGIMLWRMLTGRLPVDPDDMSEVYGFYMGQNPAQLSVDVVPGVSAQVSHAITAALSTDPSDRLNTAALLLEKLERSTMATPMASTPAAVLSTANGATSCAAPTSTPDTPVRADAPAGFVLIPSGSFTMGSPVGEPGRDNNEVQHVVEITRPFYLQTHPVTQSEWRELMGNNPSYFSSSGDDYPVEQVSWYEAIAYANARSREEGLEECYLLQGWSHRAGAGPECSSVLFRGLHCSGYRLPTEAEWEYAARAGGETAFHNGPIIESGNGSDPNLDEIGWYRDNSRDSTHPVGEKAPNAWGLHDMLGNVWEWAWDWSGFDYYDKSPFQDPTGPSEGASRIMRGGSWYDQASCARAAKRNGLDPRLRHDSLGFRLARSSGEPSQERVNLRVRAR